MKICLENTGSSYTTIIDTESNVTITKVYIGLRIVSDVGEVMSVCMRDGGFEFKFGDSWYTARNGEIRKVQAVV